MSAAKRYGGAHSPGGAKPAAEIKAKPKRSALSGRKTKHFSWRVLGLYLAPTVLLLTMLDSAVFNPDLGRIAWSWGGYAALMFGAWMTNEGLKAEAAFNDRVIAKPPAFPRKLFGAAIIGLAVAGICFLGADAGLLSIFYGALAAGAHVTAFGLDPMKAKGVSGISDVELDRVAEKVEQAEAVVNETIAAPEKLRDRALTDRIDALALAARDILREIQSDPRDLSRSRRFLSVHLVGLRDATVKFADAAGKGAADDLKGRYADLLGDLETSFASHRTALLSNDQTDLEVEIDVLRDRLKG